jgi:hypothetical protein
LAHNTAARLADQHQKEKEEQKLLIEAWAILVKDYPKVIPLKDALELVKAAHKKICDLPKRSLADRIAGKPAMISLASHLTEPTAVASSFSVTLDDAPSQVVALLPYDDSSTLTGDVPWNCLILIKCLSLKKLRCSTHPVLPILSTGTGRTTTS